MISYISQSHISPPSVNVLLTDIPPTHPPTQLASQTYLCIQLKHRDWRRELLQQGKGEKEGRFLTTWREKLINPGLARLETTPATHLTGTEGRTYRQDHENTQSKYSTLKFIARLITNNSYTVNFWNKHFLKFYIYWLTQVALRPHKSLEINIHRNYITQSAQSVITLNP